MELNQKDSIRLYNLLKKIPEEEREEREFFFKKISEKIGAKKTHTLSNILHLKDLINFVEGNIQSISENNYSDNEWGQIINFINDSGKDLKFLIQDFELNRE